MTHHSLVVITGASVGIGAATARRFAKAGYRLALLARRKNKLEELHKKLGTSKAAIFEVDVSSRSAVEETFQRIEKELGSIDILVNNAGLALGLDPAQHSKLDDWETCVSVNINGLLYCTHSVLPGMVQRNRGHVINIGSTAAHYPYPGGHVYCGTKAFVEQFSLSLRSDLLGTAVRVTCVNPGLVGDTEFALVRYRGDQERVKKIYDKTKPLQPEDVAEAIYFCASSPAHVNINTLEMMPVAQAFAPLALHRG